MRTKALVLQEAAQIDWDRFEQSLHDRFGVNAVTLTKSCERKTSGDMLWANDLCALIKTNPNGADRICNRLLKILIQEVKANKTRAVDECGAGMNKIVFPIIQNDEIDGFINVCGRPFVNTDRIYTGYIQRTIDADPKKVERLLPSLTPIDPRTLKEMTHYITSYAH